MLSVLRVDEEVPVAYSGDNIKLRLKGIEEEVGSVGGGGCKYMGKLLMGGREREREREGGREGERETKRERERERERERL